MKIKYKDLMSQILALNNEITEGMSKDSEKAGSEAFKTKSSYISIHMVNIPWEPIELAVHWASAGAVTPEEAGIFAKWLGKAAEIAANSELNGQMQDFD